MLFTLPTTIPEQVRPLLKQHAIASGHWHNVYILCGQVNHHNSLHAFLQAYFKVEGQRALNEALECWHFAEYFELRGSWSVIVQPVSLGGE
jgi:hypothetical protein